MIFKTFEIIWFKNNGRFLNFVSLFLLLDDLLPGLIMESLRLLYS